MPEDRRQKTDKAADRHPLSSIVRRPTSVEQAGNRFFRRRAADRFPDQGRHREDADVVRDPHRLGRLDRIGDDELLEAGRVGGSAKLYPDLYVGRQYSLLTNKSTMDNLFIFIFL